MIIWSDYGISSRWFIQLGRYIYIYILLGRINFTTKTWNNHAVSGSEPQAGPESKPRNKRKGLLKQTMITDKDKWRYSNPDKTSRIMLLNWKIFPSYEPYFINYKWASNFYFISFFTILNRTSFIFLVTFLVSFFSASFFYFLFFNGYFHYY